MSNQPVCPAINSLHSLFSALCTHHTGHEHEVGELDEVLRVGGDALTRLTPRGIHPVPVHRRLTTVQTSVKQKILRNNDYS